MGLNKSVVQIMRLLVERHIIYFGNHYNLCFPLYVSIQLLWYLPPAQPGSHLQAGETLLTMHRILQKQNKTKNNPKGWSVEGRH